MGSEQRGISRILLDSCDLIVRIKTTGEIISLNVSVATGIILYEVMKKLKRLEISITFSLLKIVKLNCILINKDVLNKFGVYRW